MLVRAADPSSPALCHTTVLLNTRGQHWKHWTASPFLCLHKGTGGDSHQSSTDQEDEHHHCQHGDPNLHQQRPVELRTDLTHPSGHVLDRHRLQWLVFGSSSGHFWSCIACCSRLCCQVVLSGRATRCCFSFLCCLFCSFSFFYFFCIFCSCIRRML